MSCTVNPAVSREAEWGVGTLRKTIKRKKVLVIGAGPAGLETARIAAERGHHVVIYEKTRNPGRSGSPGAKLPGRMDVKSIIAWQMHQLKNLGVEIKYGREITSDSEVIKFVHDEEKPDAVVIATGSTPIHTGFQPYTFHEIEGWNQPNVFTDFEVLQETAQLGQNVAIADSLGFIEAQALQNYSRKKEKLCK